MRRTLLREIREHVGRDVMIQGWVQTVRDQKTVQFLLVRDHTGLVQVTVARSGEHTHLNETISELTRESAVTITGRVVENPQVRLGGVEVLLEEIRVDGPAESHLPIDPFADTEPGQDLRQDWRFLDLRRPEKRLIFRIQTTAETAMRQYWLEHGFVELHSPKLMASASESGAQMFSLEYFGRTAYLAQSPQFYKQMAIAAGFDRVFEIGPAFRAEPSFTSRHATEFTCVDVEMAWITSHEDLMAFEERWLEHVLGAVYERHRGEIAAAFGIRLTIPRVPFPRVPLSEALALLERRGHVPSGGPGGDLDPQGERLLADWVCERFDHEFVFVTDYPHQNRPFYHMRSDADSSLTRSFDLLWNGVEVTTGAQREHRYDVLVRQAREQGLRLEPIQFYLDVFRYGCPPHGGFGFGLARTLMVMLGQPNIREVTYLHRGPNRLSP